MNQAKNIEYSTKVERGLLGKVQRIAFDGSFPVPKDPPWNSFLEALSNDSLPLFRGYNYNGAVDARALHSSSDETPPDEIVLTNVRGYPVTGKNWEVLFRAEGVLTTESATAESDAELAKSSSADDPFFYELRTEFLDFQGGDIRSRLKLTVSASLGAVAHELSPFRIGLLSTASLHTVYLGWQRFKPKLLGASFGVAPVEISSMECIGEFSTLTIRGSTTPPEAPEVIEAAERIERALKMCGVSQTIGVALKSALHQ